jgi:hypothetical protein
MVLRALFCALLRLHCRPLSRFRDPPFALFGGAVPNCLCLHFIFPSDIRLGDFHYNAALAVSNIPGWA